MGNVYNFERLIKKYHVPFKLLSKGTTGKYNDRGIYEKGVDNPEQDLYGAIIPYSEDLIYKSGGSIERTDRLLISLVALPDLLDSSFVKFNDKTYKVEAETNYTDYGNFYNYRLKWVSNFD